MGKISFVNEHKTPTVNRDKIMLHSTIICHRIYEVMHDNYKFGNLFYLATGAPANSTSELCIQGSGAIPLQNYQTILQQTFCLLFLANAKRISFQ